MLSCWNSDTPFWILWQFLSASFSKLDWSTGMWTYAHMYHGNMKAMQMHHQSLLQKQHPALIWILFDYWQWKVFGKSEVWFTSLGLRLEGPNITTEYLSCTCCISTSLVFDSHSIFPLISLREESVNLILCWKEGFSNLLDISRRSTTCHQTPSHTVN